MRRRSRRLPRRLGPWLVALGLWLAGGHAAADPVLTISPPSGTYVSTQRFDLAILLEGTGAAITGGAATLDDQDVTGIVVACVVPAALPGGGASFRCPGVPAAALGLGTKVFRVRVDLSDGRSVSGLAAWEILAASAP